VTAPDDDRPPPAGYRPLQSRSPYVIRSGPFFINDGADGARSVGCWLCEGHANSEGYAHGGFLLTFADFALSVLTNGITLSMTADFLRPGRVGDWIEAGVNIRKRSDSLIFADMVIATGDTELMRVGGLFKPFEKRS
jgi:acyl-coenzyme A thioesterase PaaI-like protein